MQLGECFRGWTRVYLLAGLLIGGVPESFAVIGGKLAPKGEYPQVVETQSGDNHCTGTFVGPDALLLAATCISTTTPIVQFRVNGKNYRALGVRNSGTAGNLGMAIPLEEYNHPSALTIGAHATLNQSVVFLGYGCTEVGVEEDGMLRAGVATVKRITTNSFRAEGSATCSADLGGPAYVAQADGKARVVGIAAYGDNNTVSFFTRLDTAEAQSFFKHLIDEYELHFCGMNIDCK